MQVTYQNASVESVVKMFPFWNDEGQQAKRQNRNCNLFALDDAQGKILRQFGGNCANALIRHSDTQAAKQRGPQ